MDVPSHIASQLYTNAQVAAQPQKAAENPTGGASFEQFAAGFMDTVRAGEAAAKAGLTGGADAHSVVQALAATEVAVQTAVTVRDRVVEAYQEILRMPV